MNTTNDKLGFETIAARLAVLEREDLPDRVKQALSNVSSRESTLEGFKDLRHQLGNARAKLYFIHMKPSIDEQAASLTAFFESTFFQKYTHALIRVFNDLEDLDSYTSFNQKELEEFFARNRVPFSTKELNPRVYIVQNLTRLALLLDECMQFRPKGMPSFRSLPDARRSLTKTLDSFNKSQPLSRSAPAIMRREKGPS